MEEVIHWKQDLKNAFSDEKDLITTMILREIDAKEKILRRRKAYNMSADEVEHFQAQLESYRDQLKKLRDENQGSR